MIGEYGKYVAMIGIGLMTIWLWGTAWNSERPMAVRWSCFWLGLIFMAFELCIISVDVGFAQ